MRIDNINGRWKAFPHFRFALYPQESQRVSQNNYVNTVRFEILRNWCTDTWGHSSPIDVWLLLNSRQSELTNVHWSHDLSDSNGTPHMRIFLRGEEELSLYQLKWS